MFWLRASTFRSTPPALAAVKWLVYLAVACTIWLAFNFQTLREYLGSQGFLQENRLEVGRLEREYSQLLDERRQLEIGGFPTEKAIRERFIMVLPGEKVIFVEDEDSSTSSAGGDTSREPRRITLAEAQSTTVTQSADTAEPKPKKAKLRLKRPEKKR